VNIIDPHLHLFDLSKGHYAWLKSTNPPFWPDKHVINQNFNESHISLERPLKLKGFVHIEAGFDNQKPWLELQWLALHCKLPFKSVACVDFTVKPDAFSVTIEHLLEQPSLIGVRHILDNDAFNILSTKNTLKNLALLSNKALSFDCQLSLLDTPAIHKLTEILTILPQLVCIINHAGSPPMMNNRTEWITWEENLTKLAAFQSVAIKCSGWEMRDRSYHTEWVEHTVKRCIDKFGISRVMLASNFPLCLFSTPYHQYWEKITRVFPTKLLNDLCYKNALYWYKLENNAT